MVLKHFQLYATYPKKTNYEYFVSELTVINFLQPVIDFIYNLLEVKVGQQGTNFP